MAKFGADVTAISEVDTRGLTETRRPVDTKSYIAEGIEDFGAIAKTLVDAKARSGVRGGVQQLIENRIETAADSDEVLALQEELANEEDAAVKAELRGTVNKLKKARQQGMMSDTAFRAAVETYAKQQINSSLGASSKLVHEVLNEELSNNRHVLALIDQEQRAAAEEGWMDQYITKQAIELGMPDVTTASTDDKVLYVTDANRDKVRHEKNTRDYKQGLMNTEQFLSRSGSTLQQTAIRETSARVTNISQIVDPAERMRKFNTLQAEMEAKHIWEVRDSNGRPLNISGKDHPVLRNIQQDIADVVELGRKVSSGEVQQAALDAKLKWLESEVAKSLLSDPTYRVASVMRKHLGDQFVQLVQGGYDVNRVATWGTQVARTLEYGETAFKDKVLSIPESWKAMHSFMENVVRNPELAPKDFNTVKDNMVRLIKRNDEFTGKDHIEYVDGIVDFFAGGTSEVFLQKFSPQDRAELDTTLKEYTMDMLSLLRKEDLDLDLKHQGGEIFNAGADQSGFNKKYANRFNQMNKALNHLQGTKDYEGGAEAIITLLQENQGVRDIMTAGAKASAEETAEKNRKVARSFDLLFKKVKKEIGEGVIQASKDITGAVK